jgi:hypothetical protein
MRGLRYELAAVVLVRFVYGSLLGGGPFLCPVFWPDVERGQWGKTCLLKVDDLGPLAAGTSVLETSDPPLTLRPGCTLMLLC